MNLMDVLTITGLVFGPILAVVISSEVERRRRQADRQLEILRALLVSRRLPADPRYFGAVNLIPAEFANQPAVIQAWKEYSSAVNANTTSAEEFTVRERRITARQSALIREVGRAVKIDLSEADIQTEGYISQGFVDRDRIQLDALLATREMAEALKGQLELFRSAAKTPTSSPTDPI